MTISRRRPVTADIIWDKLKIVMSARDDFLQATKESLARRVNYLCSNPECPLGTVGPHHDPNRSINRGVAAHITAAAPGGKRFDPELTTEQRRDSTNGIWLCQNCAKLIDSDEETFPVSLLREWKSQAEQTANESLRSNSSVESIDRETWQLTFNAELSEFDPEVIEQLTQVLQELSGDVSLTIRKIAVGSVIVEIDVTSSGAKALERLFATGHLNSLAGKHLRSISPTFERVLKRDSASLDELAAALNHFAIGQLSQYDLVTLLKRLSPEIEREDIITIMAAFIHAQFSHEEEKRAELMKLADDILT